MSTEITTWNKVMSAAMNIPGVKVDRENFLRQELKAYCKPDELEKAVVSPSSVLSAERIDKLADACINNHTTKVTAISTVAGIPGGFAMAATIPTDMAQYYWHTFVVAQKLAYLYGIPDLRDEEGNLTETSMDMLTLFVGVMMGAAAANNAIKNISKAFAVQVAKRLPQQALTKTVYYPIIKQVAKWIGIKLTKETFAKGVGKTIPLVGGIISGTLTLATFRPSAKRLQKKLKEQMYDIQSAQEECSFSSSAEEVYYEEINDEKPKESCDSTPEKTIIGFAINLALIGGKITEQKECIISEQIENSSLDDETQLELAQALNARKQITLDLDSLLGDDVNAALLLEKGADIIKTSEKISLAEKLYYKKVAKQLGFSSEDIDEILNS